MIESSVYINPEMIFITILTQSAKSLDKPIATSGGTIPYIQHSREAGLKDYYRIFYNCIKKTFGFGNAISNFEID
jgi:hypothetical protein